MEHNLRNELWARRQTSILSDSKSSEFFSVRTQKIDKNFFHKTLIPRNLLKEQNIQDRPCEELGFGGNISPFRDLDETSTILLNY